MKGEIQLKAPNQNLIPSRQNRGRGKMNNRRRIPATPQLYPLPPDPSKCARCSSTSISDNVRVPPSKFMKHNLAK
ncbi:hypothetical protein CEXT_566671 [Caerostris extrusa]|uniref:Uncharacterized protein n=1 Tax=Caerostris extrusa TaxID=172846 RepID=A0AAV4WM00_CAEEX|nr:hypothetical protein CEXT_566671 [Caerostris extrusa]